MTSTSRSDVTARDIGGFFKARSVAIVGASTHPGKIGYELLRNVSQYGYAGTVYPVNRSASRILDLKCYRDVLSIPDRIDLAVFVLPAKSVEGTLEDCGKKGIRHVIIVSGGFKEAGNKALEASISKCAAKYGIRVLGPNCLGVFDSRSKLDTFFHPHERMTRPKPGPISFITQSGTFGCAMLETAAESAVGLSKIVSYGNRCDIDDADLLRYFGQDDETTVIALYIEGIIDGRKIIQACKEVLPQKPIVVMKSGRTEMGSKASLSHTGFLGGSYAICRAAFKQTGLVVADSVNELFDMAKALALQPPARGQNVAIVTNGAGLAVTAIDLLTDSGISVGAQTRQTTASLERVLPSYAIIGPAIDLSGSATAEDFETAMHLLLKDPQVDVLIPFFVFQDPTLGERIIDIVADMKDYRKPIVGGTANGGPYTKRIAGLIEERGVPILSSPEQTISAVRALIQYGEYLRRTKLTNPNPTRIKVQDQK